MSLEVKDYISDLRRPSDVQGIYRARVENNKDPLHLGRVQVRIPMIHGIGSDDGISNDSLPWASFCSNNGAGYNYGSFIVPEIGEYVMVAFEDNDSDKPVYIGSVYGSGSTVQKKYGSSEVRTWNGVVGSNEVPVESQRDFPTHKMIYKSPFGSKIYMDTAEDSESIVAEDNLGQRYIISSYEKGTFIEMLGTEDVLVHIENGVVKVGYKDGNGITITPKNNYIFLDAGNSSICLGSDGAVSVKASSMGISTSGGVNISAGGGLHINSGGVDISTGSFNVKASSIKMRAGRIRIREH